MKGQEFRNIILFFFPIVLKCIPEGDKERKLWLLFVFMIRSCIVPQKEFSTIPDDEIRSACLKFYKLYEFIYGQLNCTYNTHIVCCHLLDMRVHGPLTFTSAFGFESFYSEIRQSFVPGTPCTLKQIFRKILLKRALSYHCCETSIYYSDHSTNSEDNSLIYCYKNLTHEIYRIVKVKKDSVICYKQGRFEHSFPELPSLNWSKVGIYKKGLITNDKVEILKENIHGKVLEIDNLFITCPNNVLREK